MAVFSIVIVSASAIVLVASLWSLACNERTGRQRRALRDWVFNHGHAAHRISIYRLASYERHVWQLFTFRDPLKLYGLELVDGQLEEARNA